MIFCLEYGAQPVCFYWIAIKVRLRRVSGEITYLDLVAGTTTRWNCFQAV